MSMILNNSKLPSLVEVNKRAGFVNNESFLMDMVQHHQALDVLPFYPANNGAFHKYLKAVKVGSGAWRKLNEGRKATNGTSESITTAVQIFSAESNVADDMIRTADSPADYRDSENLLIATGMVNDFMHSLICADGSNEDEMKGFEFFRHSINGDYVYDAWKSGDSTTKLTSIYLAELGENALNIRYNPKMSGSQYGIGLSTHDEGSMFKEDQNGNDMKIWKQTYDMTAGLELRRDAALIRIANVDPKKAFNSDIFIDAMTELPNAGENAVAFCPRAIYAQLLKYAESKLSGNFTIDIIENFGRIVRVYGIPFLREDAIPVDLSKLTA